MWWCDLRIYSSVVACTDLSCKELHRQVGLDRVVTLGSHRFPWPWSYISYTLEHYWTYPVYIYVYGHRLYVCNCNLQFSGTSAVVRTDLSDKESQTGRHRQAGDIREPRWCNGWHTGPECNRCQFDSHSRRNISIFISPMTIRFW